MAFGPRIVRSSDPDVYSNPDSARVRARQIGCIGIRRYNNRDGSVSWMPCTNESDYRRVSGFGPSGRRFRRQQLEREVRQIIGGQDRRKPQNKSANYTKPELRETIKKRIMAGSKGGRPGQWSARKAQLLAAAYKKAGGGYKGGKSKTQRSLSNWTRQKWRTIDGKPAIRGNVTRRYLPAKAWDNLTPAQRIATNRKKIIGSKKGRQFIDNTRAAQNARKRSVRGQKHIEFHEDLEFKAIGPRKPRAMRSARSTASFGRRARKIGGALRAGLLKVPFDPNPKDADDDNIVQENTVHERPLVRRAVDAIRQTASRVAQRAAQPFRKPENLNQRPFSRAESMLDGRFIARAPQSLIQPRIAERLEQPSRRKIKKSRPAVDARKPQVEVSVKPKDKITPTPRVLPKTDIDDEIDNLRNERKNIYKAFTVEGATIAQLADQFDVVRDEIRDAILKHEKSRSASLRGFRARNSKLFDSIKNFGNSKNVILEAIKERKVKDWDSMVVYAFRNPEIRKNNKHIDLQNDMFDEFKAGRNPDGTGNLILGYLPSKKGPENPPVKAFGDQRKLPNDFRPLGRVLRPSSTTGTISDVSERARRRYRSEYAQAETIKRGPTISGRMATGGMTPAEERNWKKREWKRRKLQEFSLNENIVTEYPSLAAAIGDKGYVKGIEYLENLDESSLENLWNETIGELMAAKKQLPAYQVRNAPLSPNELATAATVKRPLVKVFLDSYKKTSPVGELAKLDPDQMNDADIESFFNTFILPELVNNGAPTNQDVEQALLTPTTINRLDAAEQLLFVMPSNLKTLELRLKFAKYSLSQNGVSSDDPDFEQKLQELMVAQQNQDLEKLFGDIESFLSGGPNVKKIVINPRTGEKFTAEELDELIAVVSTNIEEIYATFPEQDQELVQSLGMLQEIFRDTLQIQEFLKSGERNAKIPPTNPITNKPYKLREWIELGEFGLRKKPNNPLTGKPYLDSELEEHLNRVQEKLTELNNQIGTAKIAELNQQNEFLSRLIQAKSEIEEVDNLDDEDGDLLDGQGTEEEQAEKSQEEIEQEIQDFLDASVEFLEKDSDVLTINETDIDRAKQLRKRFELEGGTKKGQAELYPANPDWWATAAANIINPATGEKWGPYNGDPNHPYNNIPIDLDAQELRLPQSIYRAFLDPNNPEVKEWLDINNSHTIGRYTAQVPELSNYQGDIESLDPSKIDQRIRWDKLIPFIARVTPSWFRKKQGETIGDVDKLKARGSYGGASYSKAQFDPTVDASGYQLQTELKELFDAEVEKQEKIYLTSSSAAAKKARAKLWNLFETDGLTPSEIAFEEKILNPRFVDDALNLHMVDNNIPSAKYSQALSIALQGEQTRQQINNKKRLERTIEELRELAAFFNPNLTTARDMTDVIDEEIVRLTDVAARAGADYDGFRRSYLATFYKINSLLQTRPPQRKAKYNQKGELVQTGWDINKETKAEYINRIQRWDEENINGYIGESGERIPGVITQLINIARMFQTMTGDDGAASSTTNIKRVAETQKENLLRYKSRIIETERGARAAGISGFMRTGGLTGSLGRAEEITRQAAQKAAYGQFKFANPKILRRYDVSGFDVTKRMVGNSSGFNKRFKNEIKDATRNNNKNFASRPGFEYLNSREKELIRQIDSVINSRDTRAFKRKQNRTNVGAKISNAQKMTTPEKTTRALSVNPNPIFLKNRISGRMATRKERIVEFGEQDYLGPRGVYQIGIEQIGDDFYLVNRHGEILDTRKFPSYEKARAAQRKINQGFRDKKRGLENAGNIARYDAANRFIRQSGYLSYDVDLQNIADVSPLERDSKNIEKPNKFIIGKDAQPKQRAGDIVVIKRNPKTNKLELLAIERGFGPHRKDGESTMSLPGGFFSEKKNDKDLYDTARREAFEETGLRLPENELLSMEKLGIIDSIDWDPRFAKGMEVAGLLVEVPSTWEWTPKPGDDAVVAKFVPLEEVANGNIPLGFGHIAWLEEAFGGHEDEELAELGKNFAILNVLARQRQQRVIKGVNEKRRAFNNIPKPVQMELFKEELPKLNLFPDKLPDSTVGWIPTGPESTERHARRIANAQKKIRGNMSLGIGKPVSNLTGRMTSGLKELGVEEFSKLSRTRRTQIIDDVYNMRKAGMDKRTITSQLAILYSAPPKNKRTSDLRGFAPTDELVFKIISDGKKRGILKIDSKSKIEPLDKYSKRVMSDHKDVMNLAKNGIKPKEISETLDISEDRVKTYLSSLGFSPESSADIMSGEIDIEKRIANTQINKSIFVDSTYGRMSVAELAKKYKMDKSEIYDSINSYRALAESLEQDNHRLYRQALETAAPDLLTTDEKDVVQMRLDGLNIDEISSIKNLNQNAITDLEQTALIKLRTTNVDNFLEMNNELSIQNSRKNPTFEYMTNLLAEDPKNTSGLNLFKKLKNKELAARELRDYRNIAKDFYMMNQYMGIPVDELSRQYKITPKEVEGYIDLYSRAVNYSDKFKNKALRRALSADINNSFLDDDVNFISMRNDGASINDIARYLQVEPLTLRAKQIILMNKLNQQQGISGKMLNVPNLENRNLYSELGISDTSSIKEIENAFQSITESLLPSAMKGDDVSFDGLKRASEAFSILGNPNYRDSYADMYKENLKTIRGMELELANNWPKSFYTEPITGKMRPTWVRDAINGKPINSQNIFKMPHHLGSDEIIDDIDDGILGFPTNDSDKEFSISNTVTTKKKIKTRSNNNFNYEKLSSQIRLDKISGEMSISGRMGPLPRKDWTGRDFYAELNADKNDTLKTLRKKFGLIAMRDHPDKAPGDKQAAERFRKAAEAWSVLSSSEERRHYDTVVYPTLPNKQNTRPQQSSPKPPSTNPQPPKSSNPQPPRPPRPKLPPLDDSLGKRIGIDLPFTKTSLPYDFYEDSFIKYSQKYKSGPGKKSFVKIPSTFGPSVEIEENRFWDVYFKIADALSGKKNTNKNPRFISVGGAPGSGKTSIRKSNFTSTGNGVNVDIPGVDKAVHVDADEIKPLIPEAKNAHANNLPDWASMVHEESRVISDMAIRMGIEKNQDIVYDSTGQFNRGFGTLEEARKKGYSVELHYMVASLEKTLNDRVQARAGSDPRTMPGHIIPATLHRNKSIMHEVIDYADKFYLWDTESKTPKLLAYKAGPNDPLIIKSPRAFLHGYLERTKNATPQELENIKKVFDKPDFNLKLIPVSKKSRSASIIADFKNSKSVEATASKFKTTPREIFDIVTKSFVDPSMKEPKIVPSPNYGGYGFPRGTNSRFNPFIPPIIFDRDLRPEDFIDTTPFDMPDVDEYDFPFVFPEVWFDELGQVEIEAFVKNQPLLSRALFSYEPKEAHVLDLIAITNSQKKSWEARFPQGSEYDDNFVSYLREEMSFDDFWDEIENDSESGSMTNTEYDDVITAILMDKNKESARKFLEQFKDTIRNLLDVYPKDKSKPAINPFDSKNSNSVEVEETTRAIRELISNDLPYDSPLGTMWAFTYNIRLDLFKEMYNNVKTTNNIFGQQ